jgi:O-antigen/teichoic acid export membrane protein
MGAAMFNQVLLIVSGSLSARILGPSDRGQAALIALVPSILCIAGGLGLAAAVTYFVARAPTTTRTILGAVRHDLMLQLVLLTALHAAISVVWLLPRLQPSDRAAVYISLIAVPASFTTQYGMAILQGHQRFRVFTALLVAPQLLLSVGILTLYVSGSGGLILVMLVYSIAACGGALFALLLVGPGLRRELPAHNGPGTGEIRKFARRSYLGQVAPIEAFRLDQLAVAAAFPPAVLGFYSVATAFTNLARFIGSSMGYVLAPYIAAMPEHRQRKSLLRGLAFTTAVCGIATLLLLPATGFLVPFLFGDSFRPAIPLARVLLIAGFLLGVRRAALPGLRGLGLPSIGSYAEAVALVVFAVLLPFALWWKSGIGVAVAFLVSAAVAMCVLTILAYRWTTGYRRRGP